mmetsp:Transcript_10297/g.32715  ORF Transcript_10297/g.32715 Transcript_10297/m.32715 type:complete len:231 (-) Transcript_10297:681-1373(-)
MPSSSSSLSSASAKSRESSTALSRSSTWPGASASVDAARRGAAPREKGFDRSRARSRVASSPISSSLSSTAPRSGSSKRSSTESSSTSSSTAMASAAFLGCSFLAPLAFFARDSIFLRCATIALSDSGTKPATASWPYSRQSLRRMALTLARKRHLRSWAHSRSASTSFGRSGASASARARCFVAEHSRLTATWMNASVALATSRALSRKRTAAASNNLGTKSSTSARSP